MKNTKLEEELNERLTSIGLLRYASDYFVAFTELVEKHPKVIDMYEIKYYLVCHSIELSMKAILKENGYTRKQLQSLGHDLDGLIDELRKNKVYINNETIIRAAAANKYYKTKQFEYPQTGSKVFPNLKDMDNSAHLLLVLTDNIIEKIL